MAEVITRLIIDCETGEQTIVPLTAEELAERELMAAQAEADRLERESAELARLEAKESAKGKLEALGLTESEITALLG